jgi:hypothetical protein
MVSLRWPCLPVAWHSASAIEGAWGAAFHWIAFGCDTKHGKHQESHARLGTFLRSLGETSTADNWERLDQVRQGGWYGSKTDPTTQRAALDILRKSIYGQ